MPNAPWMNEEKINLFVEDDLQNEKYHNSRSLPIKSLAIIGILGIKLKKANILYYLN